MAKICDYDGGNIHAVSDAIREWLVAPDTEDQSTRLAVRLFWQDRMARIGVSLTKTKNLRVLKSLSGMPAEFPRAGESRHRALLTAAEAVDIYLRWRVNHGEDASFPTVLRALGTRDQQLGGRGRTAEQIRREVERFLPVCHFILAKQHLNAGPPPDLDAPQEEIRRQIEEEQPRKLEALLLADTIRMAMIRAGLVSAADAHYVKGLEGPDMPLDEIPGVRDGLTPIMESLLQGDTETVPHSEPAKHAPERKKPGRPKYYDDRDSTKLAAIWNHGVGWRGYAQMVEEEWHSLPESLRAGRDKEDPEDLDIVTHNVRKALDAARRRKKRAEQQ
jgi:hypothetical protein